MQADESGSIAKNINKRPKPHLIATQKIVLHTKAAQILFNGGWKFGRMGLKQFAIVMANLVKASEQGDPYAMSYIQKTLEKSQQTKEKLDELEISMQNQLNNIRGFEIELMYNPDPQKEPLIFTTPFPNIVAALIEKVDYLTRQILTLQRLGIMSEEAISINDLMREIQGIYSLPRRWRYTGVTRQDIVENNQIAKRARELIGEPPPETLSKDMAINYLPKTKSNKQHHKISI
jgi:integrating conjugative element protein (TIGR03761 family)